MACVRCGGPETGEPLCRPCEAAVEHEQNLDDEREIGRPPAPTLEDLELLADCLAYPPQCWLAQFATTSCEGRMDKAHLLPKSRLKKEHVPAEALWDPRVWVPACRKHHSAFDVARTLRVPRSALPVGLVRYAEDHGVGWLVDRDFGPEEEAA